MSKKEPSLLDVNIDVATHQEIMDVCDKFDMQPSELIREAIDDYLLDVQKENKATS